MNKVSSVYRDRSFFVFKCTKGRPFGSKAFLKGFLNISVRQLKKIALNLGGYPALFQSMVYEGNFCEKLLTVISSKPFELFT